MNVLSGAAESQPQAAYSLQYEWSYLSCVVPDCGFLFDPLRTAITNKFWTALFEDMISDAEESLFFLPTRLGSMGVKDLVYQAPESFAILHACSKKNNIGNQRCI